MLKEIANVLVRSRSTLLQDAFGALALVVMLYAALYMPSGV